MKPLQGRDMGCNGWNGVERNEIAWDGIGRYGMGSVRHTTY